MRERWGSIANTALTDGNHIQRAGKVIGWKWLRRYHGKGIRTEGKPE